MSGAGVKFKLALDGAPQVVNGLDAADIKVKQIGVSAAQTAAALRMVPAQFTDIFTSLAAGQAPLQVLLQQGGQLKDSFGGAVPAAKALGGYVLGLINPFTVAAAVAGTLALAYYQGSKEGDAYTRSIVMTGNASGVTAGQMQAMAREVSGIVGTQGAAAEAIAGLAGSGRVAGQDLKKFGQLTVEMNRTVGQSTEDTVKTFAELGKEPVKASAKLNESLGYLTTATYSQIRSAKALGDDERAASIAQNAYADAMKARTAQLEQNAGTIERSWRKVTDVAKGAWDAMLGIGRASTVNSQLADAEKSLAQKLNSGPLNESTRASWEKGIKTLEAQIAALRGVASAANDAAKAQAAKTAAERAGIEAIDKVSAANDRAMTKQGQLKKALEEYRKSIADIRATDPNNALLDPKKIAATEAGIRKQFTETRNLGDAFADTREAAKTWEKAIEDGQKAVSKATAETDHLSDTQRELRDYLASGAYAILEKMNPAINAMAVGLYVSAIKTEQLNDANKIAFELQQKRAKDTDKYIEQLNRVELSNAEVERLAEDYGTQLDRNAARVQFELGLMGQSEQARGVAIRQYEIEEELQRKILEIKKENASVEATNAAISAATAAADRAKQNAAQEVYLRDWQQTVKQVGESLTDALMQGGKSAWDYIKGLFRSTVLRPIIQAIVNPVVGAVSSALGAGAASAAGSVAGSAGGSLLGSLGVNLAGLTTTLSQFGTAALASTQSLIGLTGTVAQASSAATLGAAAQTGASTLASSIGAAIPYVAIAAVVASALGLFRTTKTVGGGIMGSVGDTTAVSAYDLNRKSGSLFSGPSYSVAQKALDDATAQSINTAVNAVVAGAKAQAGALGLSTDALKGFSATLGSDLIHPDVGGIGIDLTGLTADQATAKINTELTKLGDVFAQRLLDTVGEQAATMAKTGETAGATLARLSTSLVTVNTLFDGIGKTLLQASLAGGDVASQLLDAFGGADAASQRLSSYYGNFYSEAERTANTTRLLTSTLQGLGVTTLPTTREGFRALVDAQDLTTAAGRATFATLVSVSESFASITPDASAAATAAAAVSEVMKSLQADSVSLQDQLFVLRGGLQRTVDVRDMSAAEIAVYDYNASLREQITTLEAAAAKTAEVAAQRASLQDQLDGLTLTSAQLLARQRAELDASNQALFDQVQAATQAASVAQERAGLEEQLLQQQGDTAALRALELARLDTSNQALKLRIWTLQDEQAATEAASRAAESAAAEQQRLADAASAAQKAIASEQNSLWRQWLTLTGDTAALRAQDLAALNPANQALQQQIWALEDQKTAAEAATSAFEALKSTWTTLTDSITAEVERIRGLTGAGSGASFATLQAQFAMTTAQSRAGDQEAAKLLPGFSQALLSAAELSATSAVDLARVRGQTAASLEETAAILAARFTAAESPAGLTTSGASSTAPGIYSAAASSATPYQDGMADLSAQIKALQAELAGMRSEALANGGTIAINTAKTSRILDKFDVDGMPAVRV